jgi:tetratricopeptide (TPR) repeat protein
MKGHGMAKRDRHDKKEKKRRERLRQEKHRRRSQSKEQNELVRPLGDENHPGPEALPPTGAMGPFGMEGGMRRIQREIGKRQFDSEAELQSFLNQLTGRRTDDLFGSDDEDPSECALHLAEQAMRTNDPEEADRLAGEALDMDPFCVDALSIRAQLSARSAEELVGNLRKVLQAGREALGERFFEENRGHFWGQIQTRPYMRAKCLLAQQLDAIGNNDEAIAEYEEILDLNPDDNQGIRASLLGLYLASDRLEGARALMKRYPDRSAVFAWGLVLERAIAGDWASAARALESARGMNQHVEPYLTGDRPLPGEPPRFYSPGDMLEGAYCALELGRAWSAHREAVDWLKTA